MPFKIQALHRLLQDLIEFQVDENKKLTLPATAYVERIRTMLGGMCDFMQDNQELSPSWPAAPEGAEVVSAWLADWLKKKEANAKRSPLTTNRGSVGSPNKSTTQNPSAPDSQGSSPMKHPAAEPLKQPNAKHLKPGAQRLTEWHIKKLLGFVEGWPEITEAVELLQISIAAVDDGLDPEVLMYHLRYLESLVPDDVQTSLAVKMVHKCILWRHL
ncbi:hypothetical protein J3R82DRAFT_3383 [Butyriboletus roseoflavus]|nr:hypothetical protein J3R82DRAFT_3383 [Butyriboletus roseoflavus]